MSGREPPALRLLGPKEFAPRLLGLIENARRELWLVSPYAHLHEVEDIQRAILKRASQGTHVHLVVRDQHDQIKALDGYGPALVEAHVRLFALEGLHARIYWSEEEAILGSFDLRGASFTNSVEVGLLIPKGDLHAEVRDFIGREITYDARKIAAFGEARAAGKGHCIRCGVPIPLDPERPYCWAHFRDWVARQDADEEEKFCLRCGRGARTSRRQPLCQACRGAVPQPAL